MIIGTAFLELLPSNLDTSASLSVGMCRTTKGAKSSTVTAARALSPDATVLSTKGEINA